ncbi:MAG: hypothetical protein ABS79_03265 [Planctomycetes bacterium SCN 63-9]|nr:MAG: hypothetical protein ABS79_03265 [Planctomycetes bacterium SCN 63-9]
MGLGITVGILADLAVNDPESVDEVAADFEAINDVLYRNGLPEHWEPRTLPRLDNRTDCGSFPYSFLHRLRYFYARRIADPDRVPAPVAEGERPAHAPILEAIGTPGHHLLWHSDCEGYYVPIDFPEVLEGEGIAGAGIGSSIRLMSELVLIAAPLGIALHDGGLNDADANSLAREDEETGGPYWVERIVWLTLFEAARLSIEHRAAIHFG